METPGGRNRTQEATPAEDSEGLRLHRTACFNCRSMRQRCDRKLPCDRCSTQQRTCQYPTKSNRGRKQGSTNKPETVEKLLARIRDSSLQDEIVAALAQASSKQGQDRNRFTHPPTPDISPTIHVDSERSNNQEGQTTDENGRPLCGDLAEARHDQPSLASPLHILAAAITIQSMDHAPTSHSEASTTGLQRQIIGRNPVCTIDERVARYFSPSPIYKKDWHLLASQTIDSTLKLEANSCDPITARLIDKEDAAYYFKLFFEIRNPLLGLLDPIFHTPEYVYDMSFTLFSAVCALGCAVSTRQRDRILYTALLSMAEADVKWTISTSIKSLEIIQAIILMLYWAPVSERQLEDPYWLHLNHATQVAREIGMHRVGCIAEHVKNLSENRDETFKNRLLRNFERTWLYVFIADKSFGTVTGRSLRVSYRDIPQDAGNWWRHPLAQPTDRMLSGITEIRQKLLVEIGKRKRHERSYEYIASWHDAAFDSLTKYRNDLCNGEDVSVDQRISILAFYVDHSIMMVNATALRDLLAAGAAPRAPEVLEVSKKTIQLASRLLDLTLYDRNLTELKYGFHNNQLIMVCHAVTEIIQAIKRGGQEASDIDEAVPKLKAIPKHLESIAQGLPASSPIHMYISLSHFFAGQVDERVSTVGCDDAPVNLVGQDSSAMEWSAASDIGFIDPALWYDMGFLTSVHQSSPGDGSLDGSFNLMEPNLTDFLNS